MSYYSSDTSEDSFERLNSDCTPSEMRVMDERRADRLRSLVVNSTKHEAPCDPADSKAPEVSYVLNYVTWDKKTVEVYRGEKPIKINLEGLIEDAPRLEKNKPVIEIVTKVSAYNTGRKRGQRRRYGRSPPPPPPPPGPYGLGYSADNGMPGQVPDAQLSFSQAQKPVITIHSPYLVNALQAVVGYYPSLSLTAAPLEVEWPYCVLIHHRQALETYKTNQPPVHGEEQASTTARHIDVLLEYLETAMGAELRAEEERHRSSVPKATFDLLWLLYEPGKVVYAKHEGHWAPFVVSRTLLWTQVGGRKPCWNIECWNLELDGKQFVRNMHAFQVEPYSGEEAIFSLSVVPEAFFSGGPESNETPASIEAKNIRLGKMVWDLAKNPVYMSYNGGLVDRDGDARQHSARTAGYMSGRVIVDCEGFNQLPIPGWEPVERHPRRLPPRPSRPPPVKDRLPYFGARCGCSVCGQEEDKDLSTFAHFEDLQPAHSRAPENDLYYLVMTKVVPGFILGERSWGHFNVEHLEPIGYDKDAFKYLVLDDEIKMTVKALIGRFANVDGQVTPWPKDFVQNKGQGRIFLLHGSPGVGKTATCESIAELAHRPLISLTSGDLNLNSGLVERNLAYFLQLGERYGAMVLLDEADVYLEARRTRDIARNGLVSIFLRALEYYRGVLFLTTNRVQTFDAAFTSRIHVALHYRSLNDADRERIWLNSFERLERDARGKVRVSVATREYAYDGHDVRSLGWNGREIRNAIQTAVALAETAALEDGEATVTVTEAHLRAVVKMSRGFKNFLRRRRAPDEDTLDDADDLLNEPELADTIYE